MDKRRLHWLVSLCAVSLACQTGGSLPLRAGDGGRQISIAVVPFGVARGSSAPPIDVAQAIRADLASSGRFALMAAADMPGRPTDMADIRFEDWRLAETDYVVVGVVARVHDGGHDVEFRLIDTRTRESLVGYQVPSAPDALERTAGEIAAMIQQRLLEDSGANAATRFPYGVAKRVAER